MSNKLSDNNKLMTEWNYKKNKKINPNELTCGSSKKVWWKCKKGHEWEATISHRVNGTGCPVCAGKTIIKGINDVFLFYPEWEKYLDNELNNLKKINPYTMSRHSHKEINWICKECNTKFSKSLTNIKEDILCNKCALKKGMAKKNKNNIVRTSSFAKQYPELLKEWDYVKNNNLDPENLSSGSNKKVWWKCKNGHSWEAVVNSRTSGRGCPYCTNQKVLKGYNDLETMFPDFIKEWNYDKNKVLPSEIIAKTGKKYWWKCKLNHEWEMSPLDRFYGRGCPICNRERGVSVGEKTILYYIKKIYDGTIIPNYRSEIIKNKEIDIYLPDLKIGIEYDGVYFHKDKSRDLIKDKICKENNIKVYHIVESRSDNKKVDNYIYYNINDQKNFELSIIEILKIIFPNINNYDINIARDRIEIYNLLEYSIKEQPLLNKYPKIAKEWDYDMNGNLKPEYVSYGSEKKVWWKCDKGHSYEAIIYSRIRGTGCPICSNQKLLKGYNDLDTIYPDIASQWDYNKNDKMPSEVAPSSNKSYWWICNKGHSWRTQVCTRIRGNNCPYCGSQKVLQGYNDLKTLNLELAQEWNYEKNKNLKPENFMSNSHHKV